MNAFRAARRAKDKTTPEATASVPNTRRYFFVIDVQSTRDLSKMDKREAAHWAFLALNNDLHNIQVTAFESFSDMAIDFAAREGPFAPDAPGMVAATPSTPGK